MLWHLFHRWGLAMIAVAGLLFFSSPARAEEITRSKTTDVAIPDGPNGGWVASYIDVGGLPSNAVVTGVVVNALVLHPFPGDLILDVNADPNGNLGNARLSNRQGGGVDNIVISNRGIATFNGLSPNRRWYLYAKDFVALDRGLIDFWSITISYSIPAQQHAQPPTLSPPPGPFSGTVTLEMSSPTPGAVVRYTRNGAVPTTTSSRYTGPITLSATETVRAIAFANGMLPSAVVGGTYTRSTQSVGAPVLPASTTFTSPLIIHTTLPTPGSFATFTLDGSTPAVSSPRLPPTLVLDRTVTLKTIAFLGGTSSSVTTRQYTYVPAPAQIVMADVNYFTQLRSGQYVALPNKPGKRYLRWNPSFDIPGMQFVAPDRTQVVQFEDAQCVQLVRQATTALRDVPTPQWQRFEPLVVNGRIRPGLQPGTIIATMDGSGGSYASSWPHVAIFRGYVGDARIRVIDQSFVDSNLTGQHCFIRIGGVNASDAARYWTLRAPQQAASSSVATICAADFNATGQVDVRDLFDFLNAWFAGSLEADFDGSGGILPADVFAFLTDWFAGC